MLSVADIMTTDVFTIRSSAKVTQAIALMQKEQVRSLIVEKAVKGGAYGIITERDIVYRVTAKSADPATMMVCEIMKVPCIAVEPELVFSAVAKRVAEAGIRCAPVVENGALSGIVSVTDIIKNSNVKDIHLPKNWSQQVETALRHRRLCWGEACDLEQESEVGRKILQALQPRA